MLLPHSLSNQCIIDIKNVGFNVGFKNVGFKFLEVVHVINKGMMNKVLSCEMVTNLLHLLVMGIHGGFCCRNGKCDEKLHKISGKNFTIQF